MVLVALEQAYRHDIDNIETLRYLGATSSTHHKGDRSLSYSLSFLVTHFAGIITGTRQYRYRTRESGLKCLVRSGVS